MKKVKATSTNEASDNETGSIDSDDVDDIITVIEKYLDEILIYYENFNAFSYEKSRDTRGVTVTTQMEQSLSELITLIEKLIFATGSTLTSLKSWKIQLADREIQEIYN